MLKSNDNERMAFYVPEERKKTQKKTFLPLAPIERHLVLLKEFLLIRLTLTLLDRQAYFIT